MCWLVEGVNVCICTQLICCYHRAHSCLLEQHISHFCGLCQHLTAPSFIRHNCQIWNNCWVIDECLMSSGYVMTAFNTTIITAFSKTKSTIMHENNESMALIGLTVGVSFNCCLLFSACLSSNCRYFIGRPTTGKQSLRDNTSPSYTTLWADVSWQ